MTWMRQQEWMTAEKATGINEGGKNDKNEWTWKMTRMNDGGKYGKVDRNGRMNDGKNDLRQEWMTPGMNYTRKDDRNEWQTYEVQ
jgi:hypothetical protein